MTRIDIQGKTCMKKYRTCNLPSRSIKHSMQKILKLTHLELNKIVAENLKETDKENRQLRLKIKRLEKSIYHREKSKWCNLKEHEQYA